MLSLGSELKNRREQLNLGLRELCEKSSHPGIISEPISPAYYSRLERGVDVDPEKISLEKCWTLGMVLQDDPLYFFVLSRSTIFRKFLDAETRAKVFPVVSVDAPASLPKIVREARERMGLGLRELSSIIAKTPACAFPLSPGFLSQIESNFRGLASVVSGEKLWALGVALEIDPLLLYVASRGLDPQLLGASRRRLLFGL